MARKNPDPTELISAKHAIGMHPDVRAVRGEVRRAGTKDPQIYIEAEVVDLSLSHALHRELQARLIDAIPVGMDYQLDLVPAQK